MPSQTFLISSLLLALAPLSLSDALYNVTDIGTLDGNPIRATAMNDSGQVTGYSNAISSRAFLYSNGQMMNLGTLGGDISQGYGINNIGQVTGMSFTATGSEHAFLYTSGQMTDLDTLPSYELSSGVGINNAGQVVGAGLIRDSVGASHPFLYSDGHLTDLDFNGTGNAINDHGQVTGTSLASLSPSSHAFIYSDGQMTDLGTLPGHPFSSGSAINNAGQVAGSAGTGFVRSPSRAFLYQNGQLTDLGTFPGGFSSQAFGINEAGQVVGYSSRFTSEGVFQHAFLYRDGEMLDLNDLIDPTLAITLVEARAINNNGQIVANGFSPNPNSSAAYLLSPVSNVPEPSTLKLFGSALLGLTVWSCWYRRAY